jgi:hypothetical protein
MFEKQGAIFAIKESNRIKTAKDWADVIDKTSTADGIIINKNIQPNNDKKVVCEIDLNNFIYIHTTIMASVDLQPESDYWITKDTEKYINTNGDAWQRSVLLSDYLTFVDSGIVYVEHDQHPERAKGKVLDAVARDMGDTILIDLLFCVDKKNKDLTHNIEIGFANAVSMGCTTKYTICSICGHVAHDEKQYCAHIKSQKNQMVKCVDGEYRKVCELCFGNTFYDCSIVVNPAFAGAVFRKIVAADKISMQLLSNILCRSVNESEFRSQILKIASKNGVIEHAIERSEDDQNNKSYDIEDTKFDDIPYNDQHNTLEKFDEQQSEGVIDAGKGKKKTAKCADYGSLVILNQNYNIPSQDRVAKSVLNFIGKDIVGRLVGREDNNCAIYFNRIGMVKNIPSNIVSNYSIDFNKSAKKNDDDVLSINRKGTFTNDCRFQVLKVEDDSVEVRWLDGPRMGEKETLKKKEFSSTNIKWASTNLAASFDAKWNGKFYQLNNAKWNEKIANVLDQFESHIDNVQHDMTYVMPITKKNKYSKSFKITTKIASNTFKFNATVNNDNIHIDVNTTSW